MRRLPHLFVWALGITVFAVGLLVVARSSVAEETIRPYEKNPFYWQYDGEPVLLIGGSREDNLFNHPEGLQAHLDAIAKAGGNYVRNTMSDRDPENRYAFARRDDGLYDLEQWDEEYWERFEHFLRMCQQRGIIVQIEIWDPWDVFKSEAPLGYGPENTGWESHPYNPANNVNYTAEQSRLDETIDYYSKSTPTDHRFFHTVPAMDDNQVVRKHQEAFVDRLLDAALKYPNVLYCMNNEIGENPEWGRYWASYVRKRAAREGVDVFLADMRRNSNFKSDEQLALLHDDEHFDFFEISQNSVNKGQHHYDQIQVIRNRMLDDPKPLNNVKIYGGAGHEWTGGPDEATKRMWRNVFGGLASSRFHRPGPADRPFGLGATDPALRHLRCLRDFTDAMTVFNCAPRPELLGERQENDAYCLAEPGHQYAVYFPAGGSVTVDMSAAAGQWQIRWQRIPDGEWSDGQVVEGGGKIKLDTSEDGGQWAALLLPK